MDLLEGFELVENRLAVWKSLFVNCPNVPAVMVNENGFIMSKKFCETFGFKPNTGILVTYHNKAGTVAFKVAQTGAEQTVSYKFQAMGKVAKQKAAQGEHVTCCVTCSSFIEKKLGDTYNKKMYAASLYPGSSGWIVIQLDKPIE